MHLLHLCGRNIVRFELPLDATARTRETSQTRKIVGSKIQYQTSFAAIIIASRSGGPGGTLDCRSIVAGTRAL
jgi:hypothetical protein